MRIDYSTAMALFTITYVLTVVGLVLLMKRKYGQLWWKTEWKLGSGRMDFWILIGAVAIVVLLTIKGVMLLVNQLA